MDLSMVQALFLGVLFSICLDHIVCLDQRCFSQDVSLQHRMCSCLPRSVADSIGNSSQIAGAPAPSPQMSNGGDDLFAPSQPPDRRYDACSVSPSNTSWCLCAKSVSNSSHKLQVEIPSTLEVGRIKSLFPPKTLDPHKLKACSCLCPALNNNATFIVKSSQVKSIARRGAADSPSPMQQGYAPAMSPAADASFSFSRNFSLCLCNCSSTTLSTPPAKAPAMSSGDDDDHNHSGGQMGAPPPADGSCGDGSGALISRKQPQPHVTITNIHKAKEKVLAYVLPIVGFSVCVLVFVTVVLWKNLLFFRSSSSVVSSFSHLENEI